MVIIMSLLKLSAAAILTYAVEKAGITLPLSGTSVTASKKIIMVSKLGK